MPANNFSRVLLPTPGVPSVGLADPTATLMFSVTLFFFDLCTWQHAALTQSSRKHQSAAATWRCRCCWCHAESTIWTRWSSILAFSMFADGLHVNVQQLHDTKGQSSWSFQQRCTIVHAAWLIITKLLNKHQLSGFNYAKVPLLFSSCDWRLTGWMLPLRSFRMSNLRLLLFIRCSLVNTSSPKFNTLLGKVGNARLPTLTSLLTLMS